MSNAFDYCLRLGKLKSDGKYHDPSKAKIKFLENISFQTVVYSKNDIEFVIHGYSDKTQLYFESDRNVIIKIGHCYPTLALKNSSNYKHELSDSDIEELFLSKKDELCNCIKGIFVLVIFEKLTGRIYALSSKSGLLKLFYYFTGEVLLLSTSLDSIAKDSLYSSKINYIAILEQLVFLYPLGDITLLENIKILDNHSCLTYESRRANLQIKQYYNYNSILHETPMLSWQDTYERTPDIFNQVVDNFLDNNASINAALTSGFDSRAVLSRTVNQKHRIRYYSYGSSELSDDVRIPQQISQKLSLQYKWIKFDSKFFAEYDYYANQLLFFSDGFGNIKRCNQMFSHSVLSEFSRHNITGYIGSELLRPNNMMDTNILPPMVSILYRDKLNNDNIMGAIAKCPEAMQPDLFDKIKDDTIQHISESMAKIMTYDEAYLNLYHYTIRYSLWKFFGQEFHATRIYDYIQSPYIDDDFIEFILTTPVPNLNRHAFERNTSDLRRGQLFYLPILERNFPQLTKFPTGRGYSPNQLKSLLFPLNIILPFVLRRIYKKTVARHSAFHASEWNRICYKANPHIFIYENDIFKSIELSSPLIDREYSLKKWIMDFA